MEQRIITFYDYDETSLSELKEAIINLNLNIQHDDLAVRYDNNRDEYHLVLQGRTVTSEEYEVFREFFFDYIGSGRPLPNPTVFTLMLGEADLPPNPL